MAITPTSSVPTATSVSAGAQQTLAGRFENFLTLLTKQLQNQDPLNPLDSTEFVAQLVSFTEVEQSINTNRHMESLVALLSNAQTTSSLEFLGKTIEAEGDTARLRDGKAAYSYALPRAAASTVITITDSAGKIVYQGQGAITAGEHDFVWDGKNANGIAQPEGNYKIAIKAKDSKGDTLATTTTIEGRVNGVNHTRDGVVLDVDGNKVPISGILAVRETAIPTPTPIPTPTGG